MRRLLLILSAAIAVIALPTSALAGKPATYKAGTYNGKLNYDAVTVVLKRGSCKAAAGQKKSSLKLCVSLTKSSEFLCHSSVNAGVNVTAFATPVQLPSSGKVTQKTPVSAEGAFPGSPPSTGEATFAVAFKKNGTAAVTLSLSLTIPLGTQSVPCTGSETFATKAH